MHILAAMFLLSVAARAELLLSVVNGSTQTPLGGNYTMGPVLAGDRVTVLLSLRNTGSIPVTVTRFNVDHPAFQLNAPSVPFVAVPGVPSAVTLSFGAALPGPYSANLRLNERTIALSGDVLPASLLTVTPACPERAARTVDFGIVPRGQWRDCAFEIYNGAADGVTVPVSTGGAGFSGSGTASIGPGQTAAYTVRFQPATSQAYTGTLRIGPVMYTLTGQGAAPVVPAPEFSFDPRPPASAQQRQLSARLPSPSPVTGSGTLTLSFFPNPSLPDDSSVAFLNPFGRILSFSVREGSTEVLFGSGQPFAVFQTGTTAGQIRFSMSSAQMTFESEPVAALTIPPSPVALDLSSGARSTFDLQIRLAGYDNTYSTGVMVFTFFDARGAPITAPFQANFTQAFRTFYASTPAGSAFQVIVKFPVTGDIGRIAAVEVELVNQAGSTRTARLNF